MERFDIAEPWMLGHFCEHCDGEIETGQVVAVLDIDHSDRVGHAVATIVHQFCSEEADANAHATHVG